MQNSPELAHSALARDVAKLALSSLSKEDLKNTLASIPEELSEL